jgi:hypothetical protein
MTKFFRTLVAIALISTAACGGGSTESDVASTDSQALEQTDDTNEEVDATDTDDESDGTRSSAIPFECFADDESFDACWEGGEVPDECVDADGFILDECYPSDDEGSSEAASEPTPALGAGSVSSGFDPAVDAFSFANYGDDTGAVDLTAIEMQRMFGDGVCANQVDGCTLAPPARQWMEQMNKYMAGGHCEGMAVLSSLFYFGDADPSAFGADSVRDLEISGNDALQREIAYWWVTQGTSPGASQSVSGSPSEVLDTLVESFSDGQQADESWSLGIFKRDGTGGHAVTPYAVEENGDGTYKVFVYDNNYPSQGRVLTIDRDANTWQYEASTNPNVETDLYEGDADTDTLSVHPASPRVGRQEAAFGADGEISGYATVLQAGTDGIEIWLDGDANLLITALDGRRLGWLADGSFVNEIEGATATDLKFGVAVWEVDQEPVYVIPGDITDFSVTIDGSQLDEQAVSSVTMIGSDFNMVVEDVVLDPGEWDLIEVSVVDGDYLALNYSSDYADSPEIWFGLSTDDADYEFIVRGSDIEPGGSFNVILDYPNGDFILDTTEQTEFGIYELLVARIDDEGEYVFGNEDIELQPDDTLYVNFFEWEGDGSPMYLDFDFGSDGSIDETLALEDEAGLAEDFFEE